VAKERGDRKALQQAQRTPPAENQPENMPEGAERELEVAVLEIIEALRPALEALADDPSD